MSAKQDEVSSAKAQYRVRNWREYNQGLKARGSLTVWLSEEVLAEWFNDEATGRRGASRTYADGAIAFMVTVQALFHLPGRATQGFVESLFELMGIELLVPDHSTLSRRMGQLTLELPTRPVCGAMHLVVDSTGLKVYGEGEWKVRGHGVSKRRTWRKLHVGVNEATGEIWTALVTTNDVSDDEAFADVLGQVEAEIEQVSGDGAYDKRKCYESIAERQSRAAIPPRRDAVPWPEDGESHARNQALQRIEAVGRKAWKQESGYHRRSLAETTMFRFKTIFGDRVRRQRWENQAVEILLKCALLNQMFQLGSPDSYKLDA
jgi:IS5 family transposase